MKLGPVFIVDKDNNEKNSVVISTVNTTKLHEVEIIKSLKGNLNGLALGPRVPVGGTFGVEFLKDRR